MTPPIVISQALWELTWNGLWQRGKGMRESACVWAGERLSDRRTVQEVIFLDDLPGVRSGRLSHRTTRPAVADLFSRLRAGGWEIVSDVHTHPSDWVDLSLVDRQHPLEYRIGLVALVLPHFAKGPMQLASVGMHEYRGNYLWRRLTLPEVQLRLQIKGREGA